MHIALWITGLGAIIFVAITAFLANLPERNADDSMGKALGTLLFGGIAASFLVGWLGLVIFKAAST